MKKNISKFKNLIPVLSREQEISFSQGFYIFMFSFIFFGLIGITEGIPILVVLSIILFFSIIFIILSFNKSKKYPKFRHFFTDKDFLEKLLVLFVMTITIILGILFILSSLIRIGIIPESVMNYFLFLYLVIILLAILSMFIVFTSSLIKSIKKLKNIRR